MPEAYRKQLTVTSSECDRFQRLRLSALFSVLQEVSITDVELTGLTRDKTLDRGFLWVISRMKLEMNRPISYGETITVSTSPGERMHMVFPRYYTIMDAEGEVVLRGSALWTLINVNTREAINPEKENIEIPGIEEEDRIDLPMGLKKISSDNPASIRQALYSHIDLNGHMNNARYFDLAQDHMPDELRKRPVKEISADYISEARTGDEITLGITCLVTVYAAKQGYINSDNATIKIQADTGIAGDVDGNGVVNVADHVKLSEIIMKQK